MIQLPKASKPYKPGDLLEGNFLVGNASLGRNLTTWPCSRILNQSITLTLISQGRYTGSFDSCLTKCNIQMKVSSLTCTPPIKRTHVKKVQYSLTWPNPDAHFVCHSLTFPDFIKAKLLLAKWGWLHQCCCKQSMISHYCPVNSQLAGCCCSQHVLDKCWVIFYYCYCSQGGSHKGATMQSTLPYIAEASGGLDCLCSHNCTL